MKKNRVSALLIACLLSFSFALTSCKTSMDSTDNSLGNRPGSDIIGVDGGKDPNYSDNGTSTPSAPNDSEYAVVDDLFDSKSYEKMLAAYRKKEEGDRLASLGVSSEDYVWTIVSLSGENLIDHYMHSGSHADLSEYAANDGRSYRRSLSTMQENVKKQISALDGGVEYSFSYTLAENGFAAKIKYKDLSKVEKIPGVVSVRISEQYDVPMGGETTLYSTAAYEKNGSAEGEHYLAEEDEYMGEGMFIAVLDSGLDTSHPAFSGDCIDISRAKADEAYVSTVLGNTVASNWTSYYGTSGDSVLDIEDVYVNNKLVFRYDYGNKDADVCPHPFFANVLDHGTHTAGIAVGYDTTGFTDEDGNRLTGDFRGVAPMAQLAFMKVFYEDPIAYNVYSEDIYIAAALEDCIMLGVDAINLSLGSARGFSVDNSSQNYIYTYCRYADMMGINVQAAVGNNFTGAYDGASGDMPLAEHPDYGSVNSPASYASTLAVGSYGGKNTAQYYAVVNGGTDEECKVYYSEPADYADPNGENYGVKHFATDLGEGTYSWVYVRGKGNYADFKGAKVSGKIAFVQLNDSVSSNEMMVNAARCGAKAVVFVDEDYKATRETECTVVNALPYCGMSLIDAERMFANGAYSGTITFDLSLSRYDLMSEFSSWGCTNTLNIKPEIVGVGGNVYSSLISEKVYGSSAVYYNHNYGVYSGTSMAAPEISAYLVRLKQLYAQRFPELSSAELSELIVKVAMSTANVLTDLNDVCYSPRYQGAGALDYEAAKVAQSYFSVVGQSKPKIELGEDEKRAGVYLLRFDICNISDKAKTFAIDLDVMTDSLCNDGKTVSLSAHVLEDYGTKISVSGKGVTLAGNAVTVPASSNASVAVTLTLTEEQKQYLNENFKYGSYVEGYVRAEEQSGDQLSMPFLAFYGDWEESALMDYTAFDAEEAYLFASQIVGTYNGGYTSAILGLYPYTVPEGYEDIGFDADRLAIGSKTGGYYSISSLYVGLLRNADTLSFNIFNQATGETYTSHSVTQIGKASYVESAGQMYPVIQGVSYGTDLPNNTIVTFTIRASLDGMGKTVNVKDTVSFDIAIDSEAPRMYSDSVGVYRKEDGSVWASINVYDNHVVSCVSFYTYTQSGYQDLLDAPIPVNLKNDWVQGNKCTLEFDITKYVGNLESNLLGVVLEDAAMNRASYRLAITGDLTVDEEGETEGSSGSVNATSLSCEETVNIAQAYSSDLGVKISPAGASYTLSVDESYQNTGRVEIDEARKLVVAREAGVVRIKVQSGALTKYCIVNVYVVDGEWVYSLVVENGNGILKYDEEQGKYVIDSSLNYDPENGQTTKYYRVYAYRGDGTHVVIPSYYEEEDGTKSEIVEIGQNAFLYCPKMYSVTIPKTVRRIAWQGFAQCIVLEDLIFEEGSVLNEIASSAFEYNFKLNNVEIPASVRRIGSRSFNDCYELDTLTFGAYTAAQGAKLNEIQYGAFSGTAIENVILPETVTSISSAFADTPLRRIVLPEGLDAANTSFTNCTQLREVVLSNSSTSVGYFAGCTSLKSITIPEGVKTIGASAFQGCSALTSIVIPDSVESIGQTAFRGCTRLISVRLGDGVTSIGKEAFLGDVSLRSVYFSEKTDLKTLGTDAFSGCINFSEFNVHTNNQTFMSDDGMLYRKMAGNSNTYELYCVPVAKQVEVLTIRPDVARICDNAFMNHTELKTVLIPQNGALEKIGDNAFAGCTSLSLINLENANKLTSLGASAFSFCTDLESISLPDSLTDISQHAFSYCVKLKRCRFGARTNSIGAYAFAYCIRFEGTDGEGTLTLPSTVTNIGEAAFGVNRLLRKVDMGACSGLGNASYWGMSAFESCINLKEVVLAPEITAIYSYMFRNCTALEKINLGDTCVSKVWTGAFQNCTALDNVILPDTINMIYTDAFANTGLTSIVIPSLGIGGQIASRAFAACKKLVSITLPDDITELEDYVFAEAAIKEIKIPDSIGRFDLSEYAFYLCYNLERYIVSEDNPYFGTTEEGILYVKTFETTAQGGAVYVPDTLFACPLNLQAKTLDLTDKYTEDDDRKFDYIPSTFFQATTGIEKVIIPASIKRVEAGAFYYSNVEEVEFSADCTLDFDAHENHSIFNGCSRLKKVVLPSTMTVVPAGMFVGCTALEEVVLPSSVTAIYEYAFQGCENLKEIDLSGIETIYASAFSYCTSLKTVHLGKNLRSFSNGVNETVFEGCSGLESITVDEDNKLFKSIDGVLFDKTGSLLMIYPAAKSGTEYSVPQGVTKINELAFGFNQNLEKVVLPSTLTTVGTFAFYMTEKLDTYVFLSEKAPMLESQYVSQLGTVIYSNFYDLYQFEFEYPLHLVYPEGGTGYDMWLYNIFFYDSRTIDANETYSSPEQEEIPEYIGEENADDGFYDADYVEKFSAYVDALKPENNLISAELDELKQRFFEEYNTFFDLLVDRPEISEQFYESYVAEANAIVDKATSMFSVAWTKIYDVLSEIERMKEKGNYGEDALESFDSAAYYVQYQILNAYTLSEIEEAYKYYIAFIEGIPTVDKEETFVQYLTQKKAELEGLYDQLDRSLYTEDVLSYIDLTYGGETGDAGLIYAVSAAKSTVEADALVEQFIEIVNFVPKKDEMDSFEAYRAEQLARFSVYKEENYEHSLWVLIEDYLADITEQINECYLKSEIKALVDGTVELIDMQESKLSAEKSKISDLIDLYVDRYNMYYNLYDEQAKLLRVMVGNLREEVLAADTVENAYALFEEGYAKIWKFYEYNQKAYTEYRRALALFAELSEPERQEAMRELNGISYRVAANYRAILALIEKYV